MKYVIVLAVLLALGTGVAQAGEKVTICHATGSETNPFVEIEIATQAWENGHSPHSIHVADFLVTEGQPCPPVPAPSTPTSTTMPTTTPTPNPISFPSPTDTGISTPETSTTTTTPMTTDGSQASSPIDHADDVTPAASSIIEFPTALPDSGGAPPQ